jgi:hypothetical protein
MFRIHGEALPAEAGEVGGVAGTAGAGARHTTCLRTGSADRSYGVPIAGKRDETGTGSPSSRQP